MSHSRCLWPHTREIKTQLGEISRKLSHLDTKIDSHYLALNGLLQAHFEDSVKRNLIGTSRSLALSLETLPFNEANCAHQLGNVLTMAETDACGTAMTGIPLSAGLGTALRSRGTLSHSMALLPALASHLGTHCPEHLAHPLLWARCVQLFLSAQVMSPSEITSPTLEAGLQALQAQGLAIRNAFHNLSSMPAFNRAKALYLEAGQAWRGALIAQQAWVDESLLIAIRTATGLQAPSGNIDSAFYSTFNSDKTDFSRFFGESCSGHMFLRKGDHPGHFGATLSDFFKDYRRRREGSAYTGVLFRERATPGRYAAYAMNQEDLLKSLVQLGCLLPYDEMRDLTGGMHQLANTAEGNWPAHEAWEITFRFSNWFAGLSLSFPAKSSDRGGRGGRGVDYGNRHLLIDCSGQAWKALNHPQITLALRGRLPSCERFIDFLMGLYLYALGRKIEEPSIKKTMMDSLFKTMHVACFGAGSFLVDQTQALYHAAVVLNTLSGIARWRLGLESEPLLNGTLHNLTLLTQVFFDYRVAGGALPGLPNLNQRFAAEFSRIADSLDPNFNALREIHVCPILVETLNALELFRSEKPFLRARYRALVQAAEVHADPHFIHSLETELDEAISVRSRPRIETAVAQGVIPTHQRMAEAIAQQNEVAFDALKNYAQRFNGYCLVSLAIYYLRCYQNDSGKAGILSRMVQELIEHGTPLNRGLAVSYPAPNTGPFDTAKKSPYVLALTWAIRYQFWDIANRILAKMAQTAANSGEAFNRASLLNSCVPVLLEHGAFSEAYRPEIIAVSEGLRALGAQLSLVNQFDRAVIRRTRVAHTRDRFGLRAAFGIALLVFYYESFGNNRKDAFFLSVLSLFLTGIYSFISSVSSSGPMSKDKFMTCHGMHGLLYGGVFGILSSNPSPLLATPLYALAGGLLSVGYAAALSDFADNCTKDEPQPAAPR